MPVMLGNSPSAVTVTIFVTQLTNWVLSDDSPPPYGAKPSQHNRSNYLKFIDFASNREDHRHFGTIYA